MVIEFLSASKILCFNTKDPFGRLTVWRKLFRASFTNEMSKFSVLITSQLRWNGENTKRLSVVRESLPKGSFWPPPSHRISIFSFHTQDFFDRVIWYFIFSFHYSIFFTLLEFVPLLLSVSLMMLSSSRNSFMPFILRFDWVFGIKKYVFSCSRFGGECECVVNAGNQISFPNEATLFWCSFNTPSEAFSVNFNSDEKQFERFFVLCNLRSFYSLLS